MAWTALRRAQADLEFDVPGRWTVVRCTECRAVYTYPRASEAELLNFYPPQYGPHHARRSLLGSRPNRVIRNLLTLPYALRFGDVDWSTRPRGRGRLLDIGCGAGGFLSKSVSLGWECYGFDTSYLAVAAARALVPNATVWVGTMDSLCISGGFDLINISHVLEHLVKPDKVLAKCFELLSSGGAIRIVVPNISSTESYAFGAYWRGLDIPRHVTHFTPRSLRNVCEMNGFVDVSIRPAMMPSCISESILLATPRPLRQRLMRTGLAHWLYLCMIFPAALSYALGNYGILEATARRPERAS